MSWRPVCLGQRAEFGHSSAPRDQYVYGEKAGRVQNYAAPSPEKHTATTSSFQAWCAEPGGWLVLAVDPDFSLVPVSVRITEVVQAK